MALFRCGGGAAINLLWTNSDPTSSYAGATFSDIDLRDYDEIRIEYRASTSVDRKSIEGFDCASLLIDNTGQTVYNSMSLGNVVNTSVGVLYRSVGHDGNYLRIGPEISGGSAQNNYVIPTRIWGVKF